MTAAPVRRTAWLLCGGVAAVLAVAFVVLGADPLLAAALVAVAGLLVAGWAVLRLRGERSAHAADLATWADSQAVLTERLTIARDLHDLVSHGLGLITVRAASARHTSASGTAPPELLEALADVETISRQATAELRRMLLALRTGDEPAPLRPAESLDALGDLVDATRRAGIDVELRAEDLPDLPAGVQLAVCAVVREGLANAARHAGTTTVEVAVRAAGGGVLVEVTDAGPTGAWSAAPGAGHGLTGLRERVGLLGGAVECGPHGTGFRLAASIPGGAR